MVLPDDYPNASFPSISCARCKIGPSISGAKVLLASRTPRSAWHLLFHHSAPVPANLCWLSSCPPMSSVERRRNWLVCSTLADLRCKILKPSLRGSSRPVPPPRLFLTTRGRVSLLTHTLSHSLQMQVKKEIMGYWMRAMKLGDGYTYSKPSLCLEKCISLLCFVF